MCFYTVRVADKFEPLGLWCLKAMRRVAKKKKTPTTAFVGETMRETASSV